jgi:penicillin-binding protein 1A
LDVTAAASLPHKRRIGIRHMSPLKAGDKLVPSSSAPPPKRPGDPAPKKQRRGGFGRFLARIAGTIAALIVLLLLVGAAGGYVAYERISADLPSVAGLQSYQPPVMSRVYAGDARLIAELATERRIFVPYSAIPNIVKQAFVSAEDQNFWTHGGVDPVAILRAAFTDVEQMGQGRRPVGASTITQQVAKNMLLDNQVSLSRKVKEAILAMRIEATLSKERILELYLNEIYLGLQSYGVAAAAQAYFNKPLDELTVPEAAFLAALPKAPNNYNPFRYPDAARTRRDWVIDRMADDHVITQQQATAAKATPILPAQFHRPETVPGADWFAEDVRRELIARFGADTTTQGGLMVRTSMDPALQTAAERSLRDGLMAYDRKLGGWRGPVAHLDAAIVATDWAGALAPVGRPPGMLPNWRLAVVLSETETEAKLGWLDRPLPGGPAPTAPPSASEQHTGVIPVSDIAWARPVHDGKLGATPRRIADVMQPGDVVMIQPDVPTAVPAQALPGKAASRPVAAAAGRLTLRQIPAVQGALVSLDPRTGRVLAMVGGWSFDQSQFNRATQAQRQPGSSFKPFVYLTALEKGVSPSQRFLDAPIVMQTDAGTWRPNNYEMDFNGPTPLRVALEKSLNLVTLRVARLIGMQSIADTATAFHEVDNMPLVLPAAIGAVSTTVMREAGAYASIDAGGKEVIPSVIDSVQDRDGHVVWRNAALSCPDCGAPGQPPQLDDQRKQIADPASVFQLINMMEGVVQRGTGYQVGQGLNHPIAGKTGTTQDFTDAWFAGFTADLVTVVWVGYDNPASLGNNETGAAVAGPIWHNYMAFALKDRPAIQFPMPPGVTMAKWDSGSGTVTDAFKPDQVPGASGPIGTLPGDAAPATAAADDSGAPAPSGGVDSHLGGLY